MTEPFISELLSQALQCLSIFRSNGSTTPSALCQTKLQIPDQNNPPVANVLLHVKDGMNEGALTLQHPEIAYISVPSANGNHVVNHCPTTGKK
jgi:hypothetical protein